MSTTDSLMQLASRIDINPGEKGSPPIHNWHPQRVLDIDLKIDHQGQWLHKGAPFLRTSLVRLFSTLLRKEPDGCYYLITPAEKVRVQVAEVPFLIIAAAVEEQGTNQQIRLETNVSDQLLLDADHPLWVETLADGEPRPYVRVRDQLDARILPQVFYQLVDLAESVQVNQQTCLQLRSAGHTFLLGCFD
ncbi:MAG: DUF1285 domain-containing protein [Marinospirillum sp.]|uniref:DUF1285 domain-containing protein n=1 Tax=Marinospirillum sp. TaxID=2183934 RepID=UPI0019FDF690|nr:DUF1285 domain-containing protein [Marinospirillum sp.]MBE0505507.1 DUF1285 domain-containing protein [Marinospirillum sp.]